MKQGEGPVGEEASILDMVVREGLFKEVIFGKKI